jgi:hypothetical protein
LKEFHFKKTPQQQHQFRKPIHTKKTKTKKRNASKYLQTAGLNPFFDKESNNASEEEVLFLFFAMINFHFPLLPRPTHEVSSNSRSTKRLDIFFSLNIYQVHGCSSAERITFGFEAQNLKQKNSQTH